MNQLVIVNSDLMWGHKGCICASYDTINVLMKSK